MNTIQQDTLDKYRLDIELCISPQRLARYVRAFPDIRDAVSAYMWNIALCESLYPSLQCLEIIFRNAVHDEMTIIRGTPYWFDTPGLLQSYNRRKVTEVRSRLGSRATAPRIISELSFGFWASLYSASYNSTIAVPTMVNVFSKAPTKVRNQPNLSQRLSGVRKLRNKAFHHEHIWDLSDLLQTYNNMIELIDWISPFKHTIRVPLCRFMSVLNGGALQYRPVIDSVLQKAQDETDRLASLQPGNKSRS